jgi:hypothetical protein
MAPALIIIFNRPDKAQKMVDALRAIKPPVLYIAADGPRLHKPNDAALCSATRDAVKTIDWPCTVYTNFQESNLGCKRGVSTAISWFFTHVDAGIILEDDCIPTASFFRYASELLELYKDSTVMHINGTTFNDTYDTSSYYVSKIPLVWGWATWRRAWNHYDITMEKLPATTREMAARNEFGRGRYRAYWMSLCKHILKANIDTWDAQWVHTILSTNGVCLTPKNNLILNIGFDADATHTTESVAFARSHETLHFPLTHPDTLTVNQSADAVTMDIAFTNTWQKKLRYSLQAIYNEVL